MRTIAVLGATGSIGTQTLDLARRYPERFRVNCLAANASKEKLFDLVREFRPLRRRSSASRTKFRRICASANGFLGMTRA